MFSTTADFLQKVFTLLNDDTYLCVENLTFFSVV